MDKRALRAGVRTCLASLAIAALPAMALAAQSTSPDVLARRGTAKLGSGKATPVVTLSQPMGGWTTSRMLEIAGQCTDPSADPLVVNINGSRYYVRGSNGAFSRRFPAAMGRNNVAVECSNEGGTGRAQRVVTAAIPPVRLKLVLTSDTDNVYTDLHIYEPQGTHVYWAQTESPTGGLFFLNDEGGGFDKPGYGPYLYVHPAPPLGTFRIDVNYWPGGVVQHTLAALEIITDEGLPTESRRRVQKPLAMPGETQTLALITILPNRAPPKIFVPGQDPESLRPKDAPQPQASSYDEQEGAEATPSQSSPFLSPEDEGRLREAVTALALQQARNPSNAWDPGQRDCGGLVRFAFREALQERTRAQRSRLALPASLRVPPISTAGRRLANMDAGLWQTQRGRGPFADAETLISRNFRRASAVVDDARPGDVLAFRPGALGPDAYHLMIYAGGARGREVVVYHNGARGAEAQTRIVLLRDLVESLDADWRPVAANPRFLGVYEWNGLRPSRDAAAWPLVER